MLTNTIVVYQDYIEIIVETEKYKESVLIDKIDFPLPGLIRVQSPKYAYIVGLNISLSNYIMNHIPSRVSVIDHINTNKLDNRRFNLRRTTQQGNTQARRTYSRCNTGVVGIAYRENGEYTYLRVSLTEPLTKKRHTKQFNINNLGYDEAFKLAVDYLNAKKKEFGYLI
jgi:hypothetical protein